jgi:quercetin dioxygenase-like cupin family protein
MTRPPLFPTVVAPGEGKQIQIGGFGTIIKVSSGGLPGSAAVIEHTLVPGALAAPLHRHTHEDEISYVVAGQVTVQQGENVTTAGPGTYVLKPRAVFHTFWNVGESTAHLLEIVAPGGFERYFEELHQIIPPDGPPDIEAIVALASRYGLEFDMGSVPELMRKHGVRLA